MKIYKIRDNVTGKFSSGGQHPYWVTKGKEWRDMGHVKAHLTLYKDFLACGRKSHPAGGWVDIYTDADIVEFELIETARVKI